jgi:hypothetical protein
MQRGNPTLGIGDSLKIFSPHTGVCRNAKNGVLGNAAEAPTLASKRIGRCNGMFNLIDEQQRKETATRARARGKRSWPNSYR